MNAGPGIVFTVCRLPGHALSAIIKEMLVFVPYKRLAPLLMGNQFNVFNTLFMHTNAAMVVSSCKVECKFCSYILARQIFHWKNVGSQREKLEMFIGKKLHP